MKLALSHEELNAAAIAARDGDREALDAVAECCMPVVTAMAHEFVKRRRPTVDRDDIAQEGMIGVLDAVRLWENDGTATFWHYAKFHVRGGFYRAVRENSRAAVPVHSQWKKVRLEDMPKWQAARNSGNTQSLEDALPPGESLLGTMTSQELAVEAAAARAEIIAAALGCLTPVHRLFIQLHAAGYSTAEINTLCGIKSPHAVGAVTEARRKLAAWGAQHPELA